jgi:hypothetical protein
MRFPDDAWPIWTGTSFAACQIVGAVAQIIGRENINPRDALGRLFEGSPEGSRFGRILQILPPT